MSFEFPGVIGISACMQEIVRLLELVAPTAATVLLLGETGTGKGLVAHSIHRNSPRRQGAFVVVNCAALPETLLESELFGHERGAFTGAASRKEGRFVLGHLGTIFLDEIGELSLPTQAKILRVLQTREFEPLGSNRTQKVDVRIIAATNRDLEKAVRDGSFREDLYYRLNVFPLLLPPLRERWEDVPLLASHFLQRTAGDKCRPAPGLAPEVGQAFQRYPWPGNIRELENVIERGLILCQGETLSLMDLPPGLQRYARRFLPEDDAEPNLPELERELINLTLEKVGGDRRQAVAILGISQEELDLKIRAYGLRY